MNTSPRLALLPTETLVAFLTLLAGCGECRTLRGSLYDPEQQCFRETMVALDVCGEQEGADQKGVMFICAVSPEADVYTAVLGLAERVRAGAGWRTYPVGPAPVTDSATQALCDQALAPGRRSCDAP